MPARISADQGANPTPKSAVLTSLPTDGSRAHTMLLSIVAEIRRLGSVNVSLRQLATGIGTSHRMLQYYFGSRENLLGLVMMQLSREYIAHFAGNRPTTRVETIQGVWDMFQSPSNRLQMQILYALTGAAAERPELEIPGLTHDIDNFAAALVAFGRNEGLGAEQAERESRLIIATLLGLYLDSFLAKRSVDASFSTLKEWVERSTRDASAN